MPSRKVCKSPLLSVLQKAFSLSSQPSTSKICLDELNEKNAAFSAQRRKFIGTAFKAGIVVGAGSLLNSCTKMIGSTPVQPQSNSPKIVIIGAGIAGLNCAYHLSKAGYKAEIYEGSNRISGRIFSKNNFVADGITSELGGEFIDSVHKDMITLCNEFSLNLIDTRTPEQASFVRDSFYIDGQFYSESQVINAFLPYADQIKKDISDLPFLMTYEHHTNKSEYLDNLTITEYLDSIGMTGFLRKGIDVAYLTEYGSELDEQSSINFLYLFSPDTSDGFKIFGSSDERYKIEGGNESLTQALYKTLKSQVTLEHTLVKIKQQPVGYTLFFSNQNKSVVQVHADIIVSAIPFTLLRAVELDVELPDWKTNAIQNLGYGTNAKLFLGFKDRIWRKYMNSGYVFTNGPLQNGWDGSWLQPGTNGAYTVFQGGKEGIALGIGSPQSQAHKFVTEIEKMWPGCGAEFNGNVERMQWPSYEFTKASYASYKPGQYTSIRGAEIQNVGNFFFAGEHCSLNFQGYMNGGAATGRVAAESILQAFNK